MTTTRSGRPAHPYKNNSSSLTEGPDRAPARAMLKAIGLTDDDLSRPSSE
jgi:dihydroxyacid dehydratase/phosphogluconate dehydratase